MATICPTITTSNSHTYRTQIERIEPFTNRIHIDLADGIFTPNKLVNVHSIWWPEAMFSDIHLMYMNPMPAVENLIRLKPALVIVHAEADGNFITIADMLRGSSIRTGIALLPETEVDTIVSALDYIDHVLIFSGHLGHFGGEADLKLISKVAEVKRLKPSVEVGWDGGINESNAKKLAESGVDILNVGGDIQLANNPATAYAKLVALVSG